MVGDIVVCIGQMAIGVGRVLRRILREKPFISNGYFIQFLFVDDNYLEDPNPDPHDIIHRLDRCVLTWEDGYKSGYNGVANCINGLLENCDNPGTLFVLYSAAESLGSGVCCFLSEYMANNLPGLTLVNVGLLPHHCAGGLDAYNVVMSSYASGLYSNSRMLRKLDDSEHILQSMGLNESSTAGYEYIYACVAADISALLLDPSRCTSICFSTRIADVRSSLWKSVVTSTKTKSKPLSTSSSRTGCDKDNSSSSSVDRALRHMTMNIHSLHTSSFPPFPVPAPAGLNTPAIPLAFIQEARVVLLSPRKLVKNRSEGASSRTSPANSTLLSQKYSDVVATIWDANKTHSSGSSSSSTHSHIHSTSSGYNASVFRSVVQGGSGGSAGSRLVTMLQGCSPGVTWPDSIYQHTVCDTQIPFPSSKSETHDTGILSSGRSRGGGASAEQDSSLAAIYFLSPYAGRILGGDVLPRAEKCRQVGAFSYSR